jgi:hypothetical protein
MVVEASCCGGRDWENIQEGNMNRAKYREILNENLLQSAQDHRLG